MARVLMIVSAADSLTMRDGTEHPTGFWAEELVVAHRALRRAGHTVDIATPGEWDGTVLRAVDLDLDVIRRSPTPPVSTRTAPTNLPAGPGEIFVDDEDEFAEHQVSFGYPPDVVAAARAGSDEVLAAVRAGLAPYDGTHRRWLAELTRRSTS